jgi:hypothetical protein
MNAGDASSLMLGTGGPSRTIGRKVLEERRHYRGT